MERWQPDTQPQNRIKNSKIACIGDPSRYEVPGRDLEDRLPVVEGGRSGLMVAGVIGIPDPWIWMAYLRFGEPVDAHAETLNAKRQAGTRPPFRTSKIWPDGRSLWSSSADQPTAFAIWRRWCRPHLAGAGRHFYRTAGQVAVESDHGVKAGFPFLIRLHTSAWNLDPPAPGMRCDGP